MARSCLCFLICCLGLSYHTLVLHSFLMAEHYSIVSMNYSLLIHLFILFFKINIVLKIIYVFLAALGLGYCTRAFSSCRARASHCSGCSWCGAQAVGVRTWWLWRMGFSCPQHMKSSPKLVFPALAGGLLTTGPPGRASTHLLMDIHVH